MWSPGPFAVPLDLISILVLVLVVTEVTAVVPLRSILVVVVVVPPVVIPPTVAILPLVVILALVIILPPVIIPPLVIVLPPVIIPPLVVASPAVVIAAVVTAVVPPPLHLVDVVAGAALVDDHLAQRPAIERVTVEAPPVIIHRDHPVAGVLPPAMPGLDPLDDEDLALGDHDPATGHHRRGHHANGRRGRGCRGSGFPLVQLIPEYF